MLDDLDKELEKRGLSFCRYADDCNIYVKSEKSGARVMKSITRFIEKALKLKVNEEKSAVDRTNNRKFLGFEGNTNRFRDKINGLATSHKEIQRKSKKDHFMSVFF